MKRLWFKAKTYGWGWSPATWQGWVVTLGYLLVVTAAALLFLRHRTFGGWIGYFTTLAAASAVLIAICLKTGEKPGWRWGDGKR